MTNAITQAQHEHCWHSIGIALLSDPPQYPQVCCWCGEKRMSPTHAQSEKHGPFANVNSFSISVTDGGGIRIGPK